MSPLASRTSWFPVQAGGGHAEPPIGIDLPHPRQHGVSAGTHPFSTCFESGGRSYGSCTSSPMMVSVPVKPSSRKASAARSPASEAPTMTIRPWP